MKTEKAGRPLKRYVIDLATANQRVIDSERVCVELDEMHLRTTHLKEGWK